VAADLTTIITSASVGAVVLAAGTAWNSWRERLSRTKLQTMQQMHEANLRALDRQHEERLQEVADRRALRDVKVERLRTNLIALTDAALKLGDRELELRMSPHRFADPATIVDQARTRLAELRPELILDTESERLLRAMADAIQQYDAYIMALGHWKMLADAASASAAAGPSVPPPAVEKPSTVLPRRAID